MNVLHPYSSVFPPCLSNFVKIVVTLNLPRIFTENVFGVKWETLEARSSECKPQSEPGPFHIHPRQRLIAGPTGGPCCWLCGYAHSGKNLQSQPIGPLFGSYNLLKSHGMYCVLLFS